MYYGLFINIYLCAVKYNFIRMVEFIGTNAGLVWSALSEGGKQSVKEVRKATKIKEKDLYAAFGWLAKEGKLFFEEADDELFVRLV